MSLTHGVCSLKTKPIGISSIMAVDGMPYKNSRRCKNKSGHPFFTHKYDSTMMAFKLAFFLLLGLGLEAQAQEDEHDKELIHCPQEGQETITMAGAEPAKRLVEVWKQAYTAECPNADIHTEQGGYPMGAARVCDNHLVYGGVDLGGMAAEFFFPQASSKNGWDFDCKGSEREVALIRVGAEGIIVETPNDSAASQCIDLLGGLTVHQLRWIYTSLPESQLDHSGWDVNSVPFSDGDDSTHLWSELHENCTATEIMPAGPPPGTGAYNFLTTYVLTGATEDPRDYYQNEDDKLLDEYLQANTGGINFFGLYDMLSTDWAYGADAINLVPIINEQGKVVKPNSHSFDEGEYTLMRDIYLGVNTDPSSLERTLPFLEFGLSSRGSQALLDSSFWPINEWEKIIMHTRLSTDHGYKAEDISEHCGPDGGSLAIAGSTAVSPVSDAWVGIYNVECDTKITTEGGGTSSGAARLCADKEAGPPVDIANMSRDWMDHEATERNDKFVHDCIIGNQRRSLFAVDVALDGLVVLAPLNGAGHSCINLLGGLTKDQLRWIFSSYSEVELMESGWNPASLTNNDGNPKTHKWSELDVRCENTEIQLVGSLESSGTGASFGDYVLADKKNGETFAHGGDNRPVEYLTGEPFDNMINLLKHKESIGFLSFHYYHQKRDVFYTAPLLNDNGSFVAPSLETVADGSYPVVRRLTMNLLNQEESLKNTVPLLDFGFDHPELLYASGYVPLPEEQVEIMLDRLYSAPFAEDDTKDYQEDTFVDTVGLGVILGVFGGLLLLLCVGVYVCLRMCSRNSKQGV